MQNPTPSNKRKKGLFCNNCMKTSHTKDQCTYLIGFPTYEYCNVKGHTKQWCEYLNGRTDLACNKMKTSRSYSKKRGHETDVKTMQKPNQKRISMLSKGKIEVCLVEPEKGSGSNYAFRSSSKLKEVSKDKHDLTALDTILPDDLLAKIFSFLPMTSVIKATAVCKRWYDAVRAGKQDSWIGSRVQKPWYCMFDFYSLESVSYSYDPSSQIWHKLVCPFTLLLRHMDIISSSRGLLCFMDFANYLVFIHNPITKEMKQLPKLEGKGPRMNYETLSLSVDRMSPHNYIVAAVKVGKYSYGCLKLTIQIYESESKMWVPRVRKKLQAWGSLAQCVICDKVLYCLIQRRDPFNHRIGLIMYDLSTYGEASTSLISTLSLLPASLSWARLINMNDRVIVVGGNKAVHKKVCIWELHKRSVWEEIDRVPGEYIKSLCEFSNYGQHYKCYGAEGLIYIHDSRYPDVITYDMETKQWGWASRFPVPQKSGYCLYHGFIFEPRLDVLP